MPSLSSLPALLGKRDSIYQANLIKENHHKNDNEIWKNILKIYEMNYEGVYNHLTLLPSTGTGPSSFSEARISSQGEERGDTAYVGWSREDHSR